jgi:DNA polymerase-3 subunit alpha
LESLVTAGAFDSLMPPQSVDNAVKLWRAQNFAAIEGVLTRGQRIWQDKMRGQTDLFGAKQLSQIDLNADLPKVAPWSQAELSRQEKLSVGFYLSSHPLDAFNQVLSDLKIRNIADYDEIKPGDKITLAGIVSSQQIRYSKRGNRFCIFRLEDQSSAVKCLVWAEAFSKYADCLSDGELVLVDGKVESSEGQEITLILEEAKKIADAVPLKAKKLYLTLPEIGFDEHLLEDLFSILSKSKGSCEIIFDISLEENLSLSMLSQPLRIQGTSRLEDELQRKGCGVRWIL